jgi:hypothetical protein
MSFTVVTLSTRLLDLAPRTRAGTRVRLLAYSHYDIKNTSLAKM